MRDISFSFASIWLAVAIVLVAVLLLFTIFYYRRTNPPISKGKRIFLAVLRSTAFALLLFCLAEPVFSYLLVRVIPPHLAVLFDTSESVQTVEDFDEKSRLLTQLTDNPFPGQEAMTFVRDDYAFSDSLSDLAPPLSFDGKQTSLGNCLRSLRDIYEDRNLQGVVVISDGLVNSGVDPMNAASELAVPVYTLDLGPQKSSKDIRIVRLTHDEVGYEGKPSEIELEIESRGFEELTIPVTIKSGGRTLGTSEVRLSGANARQSIALDFVPPAQGVRTFSVSLPAQPEEELTDNNRRSFSMKILKSKLRILLAAGYLSWELTFLRRAIEASDDFDCDLSVFDRTGNLKTVPFPQSADRLKEYDLVILVDYEPSKLASKVDGLASYLSDYGKAVMFVLGPDFAKSHPSSVLRELLPYDVSKPPSVEDVGSFHLQLTEHGKYHPVMQIVESGSQVQKSWANIPPFEQYFSLGREKPGATVLAVHPEQGADGDLIPLIATSRIGRGKVLTTSFAPIWKIGFLAQGRGGTGEEYRNFVNNCIRWLVTTEDVDRIRVAPSKPVFRSGERVTFSASLLDESYQAMDDGSVILTVLPDSGTVGDTLIASMIRTAPGRMSTDLHLLNHGQYRYSADLMRDDRRVVSISGRFVVEAFSLEEETLYEREDLLKELAAATGGRYYPISMIDSLIPQMNLLSDEHRTRREYPLANYWIILVAVLILLSLEWAIRKRLQLL
jgi:hypothetical protein